MESWKNWVQCLPQVFATLMVNRGKVLLLVATYLLVAIFPQAAVLRLIAIYPLMFLTGEIIKESLKSAGFAGGDVEKSVQVGTIFFISLCFNILAIVLFCCLIVPGLLWVVRFCLSSVVAVAEGTPPFPSMAASKELTKGHFCEICGYLWMPMLLLVVYVGTVIAITAAIPENAPHGVFGMVLAFTQSVGGAFLQLAMLPMLAQLYLRLKQNAAQT